MKPLIVLVGGGSASGKTLLCETLMKEIPNISLLNIDNFYKNNIHLSFEERCKVNYDKPEAYEIELLLNKIDEYNQNKDIEIPIYDFKMHLRSQETQHIKYNEILLIDGIFALYFKDLLEISDFNIYVDASENTRLNRRIKRDIALRGRSKESVINQFISTVKPMHDLYIEPSKLNADYIFINEENNGLDNKQVLLLKNKILDLKANRDC